MSEKLKIHLLLIVYDMENFGPAVSFERKQLSYDNATPCKLCAVCN